MSTYVLLLPQDESRWDDATDEDRAAGYEIHGKFAALLAERGHTIQSGAELTHSRNATLVSQTSDGVAVTEGPFAESTEQVAGFYLVESDDLDDLIECCKVLAGIEPNIEIRPAVDHGDE